MTATFVLVHGAWHGGWCWRHVTRGLRAAGHEVHTPTLTGLGERSHLLSRAVDLAVHVRDLVGLIVSEDLTEVHLVGHSYGSVPATLAAVALPTRIRQLICLDGFVPQAGEATIELLPDHVALHYRDSVVQQGRVRVIPPRPLERLGVTDEAAIRWLQPRLVPHPWATYVQPASVGVGQLDVPGTYLRCSGWTSPLGHMVDRASALGWQTERVDGDHEIMATAPDLLVAALLARLPGSLAPPENTQPPQTPQGAR